MSYSKRFPIQVLISYTSPTPKDFLYVRVLLQKIFYTSPTPARNDFLYESYSKRFSIRVLLDKIFYTSPTGKDFLYKSYSKRFPIQVLLEKISYTSRCARSKFFGGGRVGGLRMCHPPYHPR